MVSEYSETSASAALYSKVASALPLETVVTTGSGLLPTVMLATETSAVAEFLLMVKAA